jgi:non-homologous end joining protein Ku
MELIEKKAAGEKIVTRPEHEPSPSRGRDLMAALEASLAKAREKSAPTRATTRRRKSA